MDSYQPIYDAVRSRIGGCDVRSIVENAALQAFDMGSARMILQEQIATVGYEMARPSVLYRPSLGIDGTQWCALYGDDLATGIAGFGDTPELAMQDFDKAWHQQKTPAAIRAAG